MKKIKHLFLGLLSLILAEKLFIRATVISGTILITNEAKSQGSAYVAQTVPSDNSWTVFKQGSPTSTFGNRYNAIYIDDDSLIFRPQHTYFERASKTAGTITGPLMWFSGNEIVSSPLSDLTLSISSISGLQSSLNSKLTAPGGTTSQYIRGDGSLANFPSGGFLAGSGINITGTAPNQTITNTGILSETDPSWSASPSFSITGTNISNWNTAFGWGNHATAGYATAANTLTFTNKSGNISQWTNDAGYLIPAGSTAQYLRGDGSLATFPTNLNSFTNGPGYITSSSINTLTNKSGNITQWTNDANYLTTEADPVFAASAASSITETQYNQYNYLVSLGDWTMYGYLTVPLTETLTMTFTNKSGNISQWTNDAGFITGYTPTLSVSGNSICAAGGNSVAVPAQSFSSLTSKPTTLSGYGITDAYPLSGNPSGFLTSYSPTLTVSGNSICAISGNSVAIPAQSFSSLTSKPTTLSGYGITDAYPLSGNPSGFITGYTPTLSVSGNSICAISGNSVAIPAQSFSSLTSKPTTLSGYGITDAYPLSGNPSGFITGYTPTLSVSGNSICATGGNSVAVPAQSFSSLTSKPTTLSGYGITDAYPLSGNPSGFLTSYSPTLTVAGSSICAVNGNSVTIPQTTVAAGQNISVSGSAPNFTINATNPITYYNSSGTLTPISKVWTAIVTPTSSSAYTIDISSAGFSSIKNVQILAAKNTSIVSACPNPSIKSYNNSQVIVNVTETNTAVINILGNNILSGLPVIFADVTGLTLHVRVEGN